MYVKWQVKPRRKSRWSQDKENHNYSDLLTATLVRSRRVNSQPRQEVIGYLGSIRERTTQGAEFAHRQEWFWEKAITTLDRLTDRISQADREKIENQLAQRVQRPSAGALEQSAQQMKRLEKVMQSVRRPA